MNKEGINKYIMEYDNALDWEYIVIHHSAVNGQSWGAVRHYHVEEKKFKDIGYHAGIETLAGISEYKVGRPLEMAGAHTIGMNRIAIGICVLGDFDRITPTDEQYRMCADLCLMFMEKFPKITVDNICPHRTWVQKTCPGKLFDMDKLKSMVKGEWHGKEKGDDGSNGRAG